jgi:hypothetical protein
MKRGILRTLLVRIIDYQHNMFKYILKKTADSFIE